MKNMKTLLGAAVVVTLAASPAFAQGQAGVGFGWTTPVSKLNDEADPSWLIAGFGSWPVHSIWSLRGSAGYDRFRPAEEDRAVCKAAGLDCMSRIGRVDGGVEIGGRGSKARPYGFAEIGAYNYKEEFAVGGVKVSESTTNLGGGFGFGVRADLGHNMGVGGELPIRWWRQKEEGEKETYWYLEPNGFVYVKFGR